jgi:UDP-N-acetylglucosamine 2-epimerase (non-hydrolysing)
MPHRILTIVGTRPEAIKLAPVILELAGRNEFESRVCSTGQHRQMLDQVFGLFGIRPDVDLGIMSPGQTLATVTARACEGLDRVLREFEPETVLVQGDTTTAFVGALVGHYHRVEIGHVEAGLRTGNKFAPFPEEMNRRLVTQLADWHFAPTQHSRDLLLAERVEPDRVLVTGNTVIDALLLTRNRVRANRPELPESLTAVGSSRPLVLITGHRRESFGEGFENICRAIRAASERYPDWDFVYPVHLNPQVQEPVQRILGAAPRVQLVEPLAYEPFVWLLDRATIVLTDSGGVQEEAPSLGKPVLVMRETTERPEGVTAGNARLVGTSEESIFRNLSELIEYAESREAMASVRNPYGEGTAARQIVDFLAQ